MLEPPRPSKLLLSSIHCSALSCTEQILNKTVKTEEYIAKCHRGTFEKHTNVSTLNILGS